MGDIIGRDDISRDDDPPSIIGRDDLPAMAPTEEGGLEVDGPDEEIFVPGVSTPVDSDNDGLFDHTERRIGTDPHDRDTDDDGVTDYNEVAHGTDPLDPDDHVDLD